MAASATRRRGGAWSSALAFRATSPGRRARLQVPRPAFLFLLVSLCGSLPDRCPLCRFQVCGRRKEAPALLLLVLLEPQKEATVPRQGSS